MSLTIDSSRFGRVEIDPDTVVEFPDGLIGLGGSRYALIAVDPDSPFMWLHSLDDPALALPVTDPHRFFSGFRVALDEDDAARLGVDDAVVYVTIRATDSLDDLTANLKAPILIRDGRGYQVINQAPGFALRAPLFGRPAASGPGPDAASASC